jgi:hypothetical protein
MYMLPTRICGKSANQHAQWWDLIPAKPVNTVAVLNSSWALITRLLLLPNAPELPRLNAAVRSLAHMPVTRAF